MAQIRSRERVRDLGEVFTAEREVNLMLDLLAGDAENPDVTILEPSCGNGNFLVEIVRRRLKDNSVIDAIKNVFGIDISEQNVKEARSRVVDVLASSCGQSFLDNRDEINLLAEKNICTGDFLNQDPHEIACDVVIGNPPYQQMDGGFGSSARPLYHKFFDHSRLTAKRKVCLIIPARWYTGGKGLDEFRARILGDRHISHMVDWENSAECFPGVDISGGICVVLRDASHDGDCVFEQRCLENISLTTRDLREFEVLIRHNDGNAIAKKALLNHEPLSKTVSARNAFGMATNFVPSGKGDIHVLTNSGWFKQERAFISKKRDEIDKWKVLVSGSAFEHAGAVGKDGKRRVLSRIIVSPPRTASTETYILVRSFDSEKDAINFAKYLSTKTVRYLISLAASSHHITRERFRFVPDLVPTEECDDEMLSGLFGLSQNEQDAISTSIRDWPVPHITSEKMVD